MITRICTGWSPAGRIQYGERFLASFDRHWPKEVELQVYTEEPQPMPRQACRSLWDIPGARAFADLYGGQPEMNGRVANAKWKERELRDGYSFRWDAFKFFKQILIPHEAAQGLGGGDILAWLDGDVVTTGDIPAGFVDSLLGSAEVCYLNRFNQHSEIGFWAVRINERTMDFLLLMASIYATGEFKSLPQWHSAFVWDEARRRSDLRERHLVRSGLRGHVWPTSPLGRYLRHDKGKRKGKAR